VVLGDSFTYGLGIPVERTYPAVLETLLRELGDGIRREVLNLGVTAYSTLDEAIVLETKGMALEPDLVLVGYVLNDPERIGYQPLRNHYAPVQWWQRSHLLRLVAKARLDWFIRTQGDGDYTRSMYADGRGWTNVEEGFDRMRTVSVDSGVPVVVIIFPMIPDREWTGYAYHDLHDRVAAAARARGFPVLDMYDALSRRPPEGLRISEEDWHPNARGHRLSAVAIRDFLVERDLLN